MAVFELKPCDMIKTHKNTFKYTVFSTDFGVYLCISLKLSPCLSNLKKSSIFPLIGLKFVQLSNFFNNYCFKFLKNLFAVLIFFVFINDGNGYVTRFFWNAYTL